MKNNKNKLFALGLVCLAFSLAACGSGQQVARATLVPTQMVPISGGMSQKLDEDGLTETQRENALALKGKAFGKLPVAGEEDAFYCNLPQNMLSWERLIPLCRDPLYDILYYVDYGGDSMIHAVRDGKSEVVVGLSGKRLFCRGGELYFLLDTQKLKFAVDGAQDGNILSYDPVDGTVAVVSEEKFDSIAVYQDLIYCRKREITSSYGAHDDYWFYFFDTGELVCQEKQEIISYVLDMKRYQQYFLTYLYGAYDRSRPVELAEKMIEENGIDPAEIRVPVGMQLRTWDSSEIIELKGLSELKGYFVRGDSLIWTEPDGVHIWDIPSGKEERIAAECQYGAGVLADETLYMENGFFVNCSDGKTGKNLIITPEGVVYSDMYEICTDGKELFAVMDESSRGDAPYLYRIKQTDKEELFAGFSEQVRSIYEQNYGEFDRICRLYPMEEREGAEQP